MIGLLRTLRHGPLRRFDRLWVLAGNGFRRAIGAGRFDVRQRIGRYGPFRLDARFAFSDFENWGGAHNDGFEACIEACRGKRCVIDIGAHIGLVGLPAASVLADDGRIVCFEPAAANRELLERHLALNGLAARATVEPSLVGAREVAAAPFFEMADPTGMNSVAGRALAGDYRRVTRPQVTLDGYCARHGLAPEVVKIDVEGAELAVLRGARETLARCRPTIFLSVHPRHIEALGESTDALAELIAELGYDCRTGDGRPVDTFALREYRLSPIQEA